MAAKRATFLCYGDDDICRDTQKFIRDAGVIVDARDMAKNPLSEIEIDSLIGTLNISHFVNKLSPAYEKNGWDKGLPSRTETIAGMAADHTLIRRPIVKASRLITIGADQKRIGEMLQLGRPNNENLEQMRPPHRSSGKKGHRMSSSRSSR
jgi:arsenate reductase-like glutaredoxin family protein